MTVFEIEDILKEYKVTTYPDGSVASLGAYLSTISYNNLQSCIQDHKDLITYDEWVKCIERWKANAYLSPIFTLLSLWTKRLIDKTYEDMFNNRN